MSTPSCRIPTICVPLSFLDISEQSRVVRTISSACIDCSHLQSRTYEFAGEQDGTSNFESYSVGKLVDPKLFGQWFEERFSIMGQEQASLWPEVVRERN